MIINSDDTLDRLFDNDIISNSSKTKGIFLQTPLIYKPHDFTNHQTNEL